MSGALRLWDTEVTYQLLDGRGHRTSFYVAGTVASVYLVVHRGSVGWTEPLSGQLGSAEPGQTVAFEPGPGVTVVATDAVLEYFAHPEDGRLEVERAPLAPSPASGGPP